MAAPALTHAHPLLRAFLTSKPAFGAWLTLPGALNARVAASASPHLSWVVIDCEHGMTGLHPGASESVSAIAGLGPDAPSTIVRIPATGACAEGSAAWQIKYALDQGARGVLVPMVRLLPRSHYVTDQNQRIEATWMYMCTGVESHAGGVHRLCCTFSSDGDARVREPIHAACVGPWSIRSRLSAERERIRDSSRPDRDPRRVHEPRGDSVR